VELHRFCMTRRCWEYANVARFCRWLRRRSCRPTVGLTCGLAWRGPYAFCTGRDGPARQVESVVRRMTDSGHLKISPGKSFRLMTTGLPSMVFLTPGAFT